MFTYMVNHTAPRLHHTAPPLQSRDREGAVPSASGTRYCTASSFRARWGQLRIQTGGQNAADVFLVFEPDGMGTGGVQNGSAPCCFGRRRAESPPQAKCLPHLVTGYDLLGASFVAVLHAIQIAVEGQAGAGTGRHAHDGQGVAVLDEGRQLCLAERA